MSRIRKAGSPTDNFTEKVYAIKKRSSLANGTRVIRDRARVRISFQLLEERGDADQVKGKNREQTERKTSENGKVRGNWHD